MNTNPKNKNTFRAPSHPEQLSGNTQTTSRGYAYDHITERIVSLLEQGTVPWHKPWKAQTGLPRNFITKRPYRGVNVFLLLAMSYEAPYWLTFRQAQELGGNVRKGEKSCPVVFWKQMTLEDEESDEKRTIPLLRLYHVFNVTQCEGLRNIPETPTPAAILPAKPEDIVEKMPKRPTIKHGRTKAFYDPSEDYVGMPDRARFDHEAEYYSTLFHELIHSTGHDSRLNRSTLTAKAGFGSNPYSKEELIAELGAAFLCGQADIVERTLDNSAAYVKSWLEQLRNDKALIVHAAAQAQKAADYILGTTFAEVQTPAEN